MMVGDNLGETQLQQLVDRQLAGQPRGWEDRERVGRLAALISRVEILGQWLFLTFYLLIMEPDGQIFFPAAW